MRINVFIYPSVKKSLIRKKTTRKLLVLEISADGVKEDHRAGIADVDQVVDGGAADVHADLALLDRYEIFFVSCHSVENLHGNILFVVFS